jgi:hypothetical protein
MADRQVAEPVVGRWLMICTLPYGGYTTWCRLIIQSFECAVDVLQCCCRRLRGWRVAGTASRWNHKAQEWAHHRTGSTGKCTLYYVA